MVWKRCGRWTLLFLIQPTTLDHSTIFVTIVCDWISFGTCCVLRYLSSSPKSHNTTLDFEDIFSRISRYLSEFETWESPINRTLYVWWHRVLNFVSFVSIYLSTPLGEAFLVGEWRDNENHFLDDKTRWFYRNTHLRVILVFIGYIMIERRIKWCAQCEFRHSDLFFCISTRIGFVGSIEFRARVHGG